MLHSRIPQITGGLQSKRVNCWLENYKKFSRKALNLKNEGRYLIDGFKNIFPSLIRFLLAARVRKICI